MLRTPMYLAFATSVLFAQAPRNASVPLEQQLAAVLRWEVLWNNTPTGWTGLTNRPAKLAIQAATNSLSYCSHDLGVCGSYRISSSRNWQRELIGKCEGDQSDLDVLQAFVRDNTRKLAAGTAEDYAWGGRWSGGLISGGVRNLVEHSGYAGNPCAADH
jgi:hypothetical protein